MYNMQVRIGAKNKKNNKPGVAMHLSVNDLYYFACWPPSLEQQLGPAVAEAAAPPVSTAAAARTLKG